MGRITMGRRIEALPSWAYALLLVTVAVVAVAFHLGSEGHVASDGTDCGSLFSPKGTETMEYARAGCSEAFSGAGPWVLGLVLFSVALVVASLVVLVVRGWSRRELAPWPWD